MRSAYGLAGAVLLSSLAVTGCGDEEPSAGSEPASPGSSTTAGPATTATTQPPSGPPGFPLTVTRDGGLIGFSDALTIGADGMTTVSVKGRTDRCRVDAALLATISGATAKVDWQTLPAKRPTPRFPDDLVLAVSASGGYVRLDDPRVEQLRKPVNTLLGDADAAPAERKHCL